MVFAVLHPTGMFYMQIVNYSHRHSLLKEAVTTTFSLERSFSISTAKVFPLNVLPSKVYIVACER